MAITSRSRRAAKSFLALLFNSLLLACKMTTSTLPRDQVLPLFNPHMTEFKCEYESTKVPAIDAQAEAWFLEARALEDPMIYIGDRDYKRIVELTQLAAERRHWKAMINLASLYIEGHDPLHGSKDAVQVIESAMKLGIPSAFDRMGTFYKNGTGLKGDIDRAYAFWQRAAEMGNPQAMAFLGEKLSAGTDGALPGYWANVPIAIKMLECSLSQGYGPAASTLRYLYEAPRSENGSITGTRTSATKQRAMKVLHEGVRYGCEDCANALGMQFKSTDRSNEILVPHIDKNRSRRYYVLGTELGFNPDNRFPNLDKVVPLPPAELPPWNGDRDTLIAAAMGVSLPLAPGKWSATSARTGRQFLDSAFALRRSECTTSEATVPFTGYWQPTARNHPASIREQLEKVFPSLCLLGESFPDVYPLTLEHGRGPIAGVVWEHWETRAHNHGEVDPRAPAGLTREVGRPDKPISCNARSVCPATGIWQPWIDVEHPLQAVINQPWRQTWLAAQEAFPDPERDWLLGVSAAEISWHLLDPTDVDLAE